jgi:ubiquinone/menaquinone biosynthesis C-methylase UbiE
MQRGLPESSLPALARGAKMLACDMEARHLDILRQRTSAEHRRLLRTQVQTLSAVDFPAQSFGAILCARALHFLRGPDITTSLQLMATWLKPGGRLYLVVDSP